MFYCIKPDTAQIQGFWGANNFKSIKINIDKCQNTTTRTDCKPHEDIDKIIQNGYMSVFVSDNYLDPKNNTYYIVPYFYNIFQSISSQNGVNMFITLENIQFYDDKGIIFNDYQLTETHKVLEVRPMYSFGETKRVAQLKNYSKAQDLLTKIGGLIKGLTLIGVLLNSIYCKALYIVETFATEHEFIEQNPQVENKSTIQVINKASDVFRYKSGRVLTINNIKPKLAKVTKFSDFTLMLNYLCKTKGKLKVNLNQILRRYESYINKALSVETIKRANFDIRLMKQLTLNTKVVCCIDILYNNLYDEGNLYLKNFGMLLLDGKHNKLFDSDNLNLKEKLSKMNGE
jgi:hypothetical protein